MKKPAIPNDVVHEQDDPRFVTALARGLDLLRCFGPHDRWLAHQEIARRTRLPKATVSRLAFTLVRLGYLEHRAGGGQYALTPRVLSLGFNALSNYDIGRTARPFMQALAEHAQAAISLGIRHDLSMVYVAHCRGAARLTLGLDVGARLPIAVTAMGRALLCQVSEHERAAICRRLQQAEPHHWDRYRAGIARALSQYRERGFVTSEGEWESDISAAGVALDIGDGREPLALNCGGPSTRLFGPFLHDDLGPRLVRLAQDITNAIRTPGSTQLS